MVSLVSVGVGEKAMAAAGPPRPKAGQIAQSPADVMRRERERLAHRVSQASFDQICRESALNPRLESGAQRDLGLVSEIAFHENL